MTTYEELLDAVDKEVPVIETTLKTTTGFDGLYKDGFIFIERTLDPCLKKQILAEEYGHYLTSVGEIVDYCNLENGKQETKARAISFEKLITLDDILDAFFLGLIYSWQVADYLNLTVEFVQNAFAYIRGKYGDTFDYDGYRFSFDFFGQLKIYEVG